MRVRLSLSKLENLNVVYTCQPELVEGGSKPELIEVRKYKVVYTCQPELSLS